MRPMPRSAPNGMRRVTSESKGQTHEDPTEDLADGNRCRCRLAARLPRSVGAARSHRRSRRSTSRQIVASPDRSAADRTNDQRRKPEEMLAFIGIRPGMIALDLSAGGGYTTELLARAIGPTGEVYGQSRPRVPARRPRHAGRPEGNSQSTPPRRSACGDAGRRRPARRVPRPTRWPTATARSKAAGIAAAPIVAVVQPFEDPVPAELADGKLDLVTLMFNYHDLGHPGRRSRGDEQGGVQGAEARRPLRHRRPFGPARHRHLRSRARCIGSRKRSCARKSRPPASSWPRKATSCAIPTTRATRTRPTRRSPRTSSC